jgi:hypothetical protein
LTPGAEHAGLPFADEAESGHALRRRNGECRAFFVYPLAMPSKTETAARRLVAEVYRATHDGRPQRWCNLSEVCE